MSHDPEDRCFYCMSEAEFHRASEDKERRTIFMDSPLSECPHADQDMFNDSPDPLGTVTPPAAEGGRPGGEAAAPAAPRRDMPSEIEWPEPLPPERVWVFPEPFDREVAQRWRDALKRIADNPCSHGDAAFSCPDLPIGRAEWCSSCIAYEALNPRRDADGGER
jgi:hypothetical protein